MQIPGRFALVAALLLGAASAEQTWAKDICTTDGSNTFVFKKAKHLRPGDVVPLIGRYEVGGQTAAFDGSAAMSADGTVAAGIFVHSLAESDSNFTLEWTTDPTLAGSAKFDHDGDHQSDGTLALQPVDCALLPIP